MLVYCALYKIRHGVLMKCHWKRVFSYQGSWAERFLSWPSDHKAQLQISDQLPPRMTGDQYRQTVRGSSSRDRSTYLHTHTHRNINNYWKDRLKLDSWIQERRFNNTGMCVRLCTHSWRPSCGSPQVWSGWWAWDRPAAWALPPPDRKLSYPSPPPPDTAPV